ncbi:hypothetical protein ACF1A5_09180 [Streptomyces sp. NPDC014864]|uniref:hypothetical protein n=1 Tax=Streptomyces sp. NPDC014864 TaxID=3364924 RepID=UPI0036FD88F9
MPPSPARARSASAALTTVAAAALLTTTACTVGPGQAEPPPVTAPDTRTPAASPAGSALTAAQAQAALLTQADLGSAWAPTEGAATWRDGLLKASTETPDCQRLLDALYADEPLGTPTGTHAVAAFDNGDDAAQLRYQVLDRPAADVDRSLAWLKKLPETCAQFTATTTRAGTQRVEVTDLGLPAVGDARQGLRVVLTGRNSDGDRTVLTLDVAAVRVGGTAITLTDGALGGIASDATAQTAQLGAQRLTEIRRRARVQA